MLIDSFNREIDYLRISVTKQCNFRCQYCMPNTPLDFHEESVELDKIFNFVKVCIDNGVKKIRITGGEPLLRPNLSEFLASIKNYKPDIDLAITTNAFLLHKYVDSLHAAGLKRINVSLDSLKPERIALISKVNALPTILKSLELASKKDFFIKLNMVPLKGINDDEMSDMLHFAFQHGFTLRYIEYMENLNASSSIKGLKSDEILERLKKDFKITYEEKEKKGPAKIYTATSLSKNITSEFGIISPHDDDFCKSCNRIRLTAKGVLCPCLYYQDSVDLKDALESKDIDKLDSLLKQAIKDKPEKNLWSEDDISARAFYETGG
ncbi:cyclic pyranopterin phosphate synthase [Helicobacter sp. 13S00401-1]|uniref:GTP 3',8-cyclase MoaA n=1 Tax=Helicobacter sp. 13S00401-1 TaxID=1905758 RepID=UPI000BA6D5D9|nr:GTP 3',8-cyclase MoaA [Helicobacter sp. 13S00401-1]PAF50098.1 cyclic pyranopterin phosphate synthase [Helicobacter sp. 13S00401-1]